MSQKLPVDDFKKRNNKLNFYDDFIKPMIKTVTGYVLEIDVDYPKTYKTHTTTFLPERINIDKCQNFVRNLYDKKKISCT